MTVSELNGWLPNKVDSERSLQVFDFKVCGCKFPYAVREQNLQYQVNVRIKNEESLICSANVL